MKPNKSVILLVNLGSPNELSASSIRKFLSKFLSDKRVVNLPKLIWYPLLYGIILPFRSKRLLREYGHIWHDDQSPLIYYTKMQSDQLAKLVAKDIIVDYAFSYANPDINTQLNYLHQHYSIQQLIVIPLYPQFSSTTTVPVFEQISAFYSDKKYLPTIKFVHSFTTHPLYIEAIVAKIKMSWKDNGRARKLIFSYHSLPEVIIKNGDNYQNECLATTKLVAERLGLNPDEYVVGFQSKFGRQKWLMPSTINVLLDLARQNITTVDIVCPGFVSDCLETLEEVASKNKQIFLKNGGLQYNYIACLNLSEIFIQMLFELSKFSD